MALWRGLVVAALLGLILTALCASAFKIVVSPEGVKSYISWYAPSFLPWAAIAAAKPVNLFGLKFLKLSSAKVEGAKAKVLWLPLFLEDMTAFRVAASRFTHPQYPLTMYLRQHPA